MTNTEKISAIENKIRGEVPRLMELSFGCLLHRKNEGKDYGYYQVLENGSGFHPDFLWVSSRVFGKMQVKHNEIGTEEELSVKDITDKFEIIGHPIQLSDLLYTARYQEISIDSDGYIRQRNNNSEWVLITPTTWKYNFQKSFKENLESSEELTKFLFNLICK